MLAGSGALRQPFRNHIRELRQRLVYCLLALLTGSAVGYLIHGQLFRLLERPLHEKLYYTSPLGGFNAVLKVSVLFGLILSLPVIIYQINKFISPAFKTPQPNRSMRLIGLSSLLAAAGIAFGYFISLPTSLHFLTHLGINNLQPFLVVNDYLSFVISYLVIFGIIFQLPLILALVNRIKPQSPKHLMKYQRHVILGGFVVGAIAPTPDPVSQSFMALPIIILYQLSIGLIWWQNRQARRKMLQLDTGFEFTGLDKLISELDELGNFPRQVIKPISFQTQSFENEPPVSYRTKSASDNQFLAAA